MILLIIQFIIGFWLLSRGGDWLIEGASIFGKKLSISPFVIGLTLIAFGTSAPELFITIISSLSHKHDIIIGNIIGSNITNTLLILGVAGLIFPISIKTRSIKKELIFNIGASLLLLLYWINPFSVSYHIDWYHALFLLVLFGLFIKFCFSHSPKEVGAQIHFNHEEHHTDTLSVKRASFYFALGCICLPVGGSWVINSTVFISYFFGISEALISLFVIAFGTSLPELSAAISSAKKRDSGMVLGNVIGSNIFNILLILGVSGLINPIYISSFFSYDILLLFIISIWILILVIAKKPYRITRLESVCLLLAYLAYLVYIFNRG